MNRQSTIPKKAKIDRCDVFKISRMKQKIKATNPHKHDEYHEIIFLTEGDGFHTVDLNSFRVKPSQLFLVKAGEVHFWEFTDIPKGFVMIFRRDFLVHFTSSEIISGFEQFHNSLIKLNNSQSNSINHIFEQIEAEYQNEELYSDHMIASFIEILLAKMVRFSERNQKMRIGSDQRLVDKYRGFIQKYQSEHHLVKDYARLLHVTPKHLNEVCRSAEDKKASEILANSLILEIKRQLLYTGGTIADVAYALGFEDASNFGTFFKQHTHISPGAYRRKML
jgi:AraC-like DNA-binding protein